MVKEAMNTCETRLFELCQLGLHHEGLRSRVYMDNQGVYAVGACAVVLGSSPNLLAALWRNAKADVNRIDALLNAVALCTDSIVSEVHLSLASGLDLT